MKQYKSFVWNTGEHGCVCPKTYRQEQAAQTGQCACDLVQRPAIFTLPNGITVLVVENLEITQSHRRAEHRPWAGAGN